MMPINGGIAKKIKEKKLLFPKLLRFLTIITKATSINMIVINAGIKKKGPLWYMFSVSM